MANLNFVTAGPAVQEYDRAKRLGEERAWQEAARSHQAEQWQNANAVDTAVRQGVAARRSALGNVIAQPALELRNDDEGNPLPEGGRVTVKPAVSAAQASPYGTAIDKLAATRGGGATALKLMDTETAQAAKMQAASRAQQQQDREMHYRGFQEFNKAMAEGDLDTARAANRTFDLGIPEQVFASRQGLARIRGISSVLHRSGITGDAAAEAFRAALENPNEDIGTALQRGMQAGANRPSRRDMVETPEGYYDVRRSRPLVDQNGRPVMPPKRRLDFAPPRAAGGNSAGLRVQRTLPLADGRVSLVMSDGTTRIATDENGQPLKGTEGAKRAAALVGKMISSIQTPEERNAAVDEAKRISDRLGGGEQPSDDPLGIRRR